MQPLRALLPFARRIPRREEAEARCELCSAPIGERHAHVVELAPHALRCACSGCAVLFRDANAGGGRFRTVPDQVIALALDEASDAAWSRLEVPVELAFLVRRDGWVASYPSPAGPVEAALADAATNALYELVPRARAVTPEVEAVLLQRPRGGRMRGFVVPLDACYELVGLVRRHWRGFDGGDAARAAIDGFFARLEATAQRQRR